MTPHQHADIAIRDLQAAWHRVRGERGAPVATIDRAADWLMSQAASAADPARRGELAEAGQRVLAAFGDLEVRHRAALQNADQMRATGNFAPAEITRRTGAAEAEAWAAHLALARLHADMQAAAAARHAAAQAEAEAAAATSLAAYPVALVAKLAARGVALALDGKGRIVMPATASVTPEEHREIIAHRADIAAVLKREAEAARPVVLA